MSLAVLYCGLTIKEAFKGVTWNAARSLKRDTTHGIISKGYKADFIFGSMLPMPKCPSSNHFFISLDVATFILF